MGAKVAALGVSGAGAITDKAEEVMAGSNARSRVSSSARRKSSKKLTLQAYSMGVRHMHGELKGFICPGGPFGYHPKSGCYPDLFNHLLSGIMKRPVFTTCLVVGVLLGAYIASYFVCVSEARFRFTPRGDKVYSAPVYHVPACLGAAALNSYRPIHLLDRTCLRRSKWATRPARDGELSVSGPRRLLFSVPYTNSP
jgi:hypothetical protein